MSVDKDCLKEVTKETYKRNISGLSEETLRDIEGAVFSLYYHYHGKNNSPELGGHDIKTLVKLNRIIPQSDKHFAIYSRIEKEWQIWDSGTGIVHIKNAERLLDAIRAYLNKTEEGVRLEKRKNGLYISIEGNKKNYFISEKLSTGKAILLTSLSEPRFGTFKTIDSVCENIDKTIQGSLKDKENYLKGYLKEINRNLRETNAPIRFRLKTQNQSISLSVKSGSS